MILGTPITWLIADVIALVLLVICMVHASRHENTIVKILELFGFMIFSGIFENIGVYSGLYDYDQHRLMMVGNVPLQIIILEGAIFYTALRFADYLHIPGWGKPFVVGFFSVIQDMTLDPAVIFDRYSFDGVMRSQWNWTPHYNDTFFGIPFFNFSGWFYFMVCFTFGSMIMWWLYKKTNKQMLLYLYPFLSTIFALILLVPNPIPTLLITGTPVFPEHTRNAELGILVFNLLIALFILLRYMKIESPFNFKKDSPVFFIPLALHAYDISIVFALNLQPAFIPVLAFSAIHIAFFVFVYWKGKNLKPQAIRRR